MPTAKRIIHNPSGYHSKGSTPEEKVHNFAIFIKEFGWTGTKGRDPDSEILRLRATRDDNERIDIEWPSGQWWPDVWYTFAGDTIKCRNISHAAKLAQAEPDAERMRRVAARRRKGSRDGTLLRPSEPVERPGEGTGLESDPGDERAATGEWTALKGYVPWTQESTAEEVRLELTHYKVPTITWIHRYTGEVKTAMIKVRSKHFKVCTNKQGKVVISFADEYGFHSVYAEAIIGIT